MDDLTVGFVGVGNLGVQLAGSLLREGFALRVHDLHREAAAPLVERGAVWTESPRAAAEGADCVVTCLPSPAAVDAVVAGEAGVLEGLAPGATWIEMSTTDADEMRRLAALAAERGVRVLEAPVTGGVHRAAAGEITVLVGGDAATLEASRAVLGAMTGKLIHVGEIGDASVLKVITNLLAFDHLVAAGEALMLARRAGLDLATAYEGIAASSGTSFVFETEGQLVLNGSYDVGFTMDMALKDLGFATRLARNLGVPLTVGDAVEREFVRAQEAYGGEAWSTMVVKLLEDALDTDLRAPGFPAHLR